MRDDFHGKRVLILGGSSEAGCLLAKELIRFSAFPLMTWRSRSGKNRIHETFGMEDNGFEAFYLDLAKVDTSFFEERIRCGIDYLVDFAHCDYESLVAAGDDQKIQDYFTANITFRAWIVKRVARAMLKKREGRMIFISSTAAARPNPGQGFYAAAKLAAEALYKNIGLELASKGITALTLRPGYMDSGRGRSFIEKRERKIRKQIPTGRILTPVHLVDAILFFLSLGARQFNATEITLDGGFSAGKSIS